MDEFMEMDDTRSIIKIAVRKTVSGFVKLV